MFIVDNQEKTLLICFFLRVAGEEFSIRSQNLKFCNKGSFRILKYGNPAFEIEWIKRFRSRLWYKEDVYIVDNQEKTLLICFFLRVAGEEFSICSQNLQFFDKG